MVVRPTPDTKPRALQRIGIRVLTIFGSPTCEKRRNRHEFEEKSRQAAAAATQMGAYYPSSSVRIATIIRCQAVSVTARK